MFSRDKKCVKENDALYFILLLPRNCLNEKAIGKGANDEKVKVLWWYENNKVERPARCLYGYAD